MNLSPAALLSSQVTSTASYFSQLPVPSRPHITLQERDLTFERLIVVGDVHGCFEELKELLDKVGFEAPRDQVLLLGDLVNKGPLSAEVVKYAKERSFLVIRGNHDDSALVYALGIHPSPRPEYLSYLDKLSRDEINWLAELPYSIQIPSWQATFIHAGLVPGVALENQKFMDLITLRNIDINEDGTKIGTSRPDIGKAWVECYDGNSFGHIYFGHDAKRGLQRGDHATGLDTGCAYGKKLSAVILPSRELVQVNAHQVYVDVSDKE